MSHFVPLPISNPFPEAPILFAEETGSTMTDAEAFLSGTPSSGTVLVTTYQNRGIGRVEGRRWHAERGMNLLFTLMLKKGDIQVPYQVLPIAAGLGLCRFLEDDFSLAPGIKWPNDVLIDEKKIAGILCRLKSEWFVIGMGVNVNQAVFPQDLQNPATSLFLEIGKISEPLSLLPKLLRTLRESFHAKRWREDVTGRLYGMGSEVSVKVAKAEEGGTGEYPARIEGIDEEGRLLVMPMHGSSRKALIAGEISINLNRSGPRR